MTAGGRTGRLALSADPDADTDEITELLQRLRAGYGWLTRRRT
jgi:hypothetical protein